MVKKITAIIIGFCIVCLFFVSASAEDEGLTRIVIEQADELMPDIELFIKVLDMNDQPIDSVEFNKDNTTVLLEGKEVEFVSASLLSETEIGTDYIFLVDISGSASGDFSKIKESLKNWAFTMEEQDHLFLLSFGEAVEMVLEGSEEKEEILDGINNMNAGDKSTLFFEAVNKALNLIDSGESNQIRRKVLIAVTDGEDYSNGGVTSDEMSRRLLSCDVPFYSVAVTSAKSAGISEMGELSRSTGADIRSLKGQDIIESFRDLKQELSTIYVLSLCADNNVIDGNSKKISVFYNLDESQMSDEKEINLNQYTEDKTAPRIVNIETNDEKEILIHFSEAVTGADNISNYAIEDTNGEPIMIVNGAYSNQTAKLILDAPMDHGEYIIHVNNVYDVSMEQNPIENADYNIVINSEKVQADGRKENVFLIVLIGILVLAGVAAFVIFVIMPKKSNENKKKKVQPIRDDSATVGIFNQESFVNSKKDGSKLFSVELIHTDENGNVSTVNIEIANEIILGRSKRCDIQLDDEEVSREHCKIRRQNSQLFAEDLNSTNHTLLNGQIIIAPVELSIGDTLEIGAQKIRYSKDNSK